MRRKSKRVIKRRNKRITRRRNKRVIRKRSSLSSSIFYIYNILIISLELAEYREKKILD